MIWREKRIPLLVLGVLLLANVVFFLTYRVQYQSRLDATDERLREVETELEKARTARAHAEQSLQAYRKVEEDVREVFDEHWSTQQRRLTLLIAEVKRLAKASNAVPQSYGFQQTEVKESDRGRGAAIGANEVGIGFSVTASYDQVRRLINLLELSQQFVIIDQISLSGTEGGNLNLNLHIKTIFRDENTNVANTRL
jgi:Tfp pilus assembly protein PilO